VLIFAPTGLFSLLPDDAPLNAGYGCGVDNPACCAVAPIVSIDGDIFSGLLCDTESPVVPKLTLRLDWDSRAADMSRYGPRNMSRSVRSDSRE
jgi:hypothetical protein